MGVNFKKAVQGAVAVLDPFTAALDKATGGQISEGVQKFGENIKSGAFGEKVGLGKYKPEDIAIDESAFKDTSRSTSLIDELNKQRAAAVERSAPTATAAKLGAANDYAGANIGAVTNATPAQIAAAKEMSAAQMSKAHEEFRGRQLGLADALQQQAAGQGPSLAQTQLDQARNQQIQTAMALAASQRGLTAGQGLRSIADQTAQAQQFAASEAAKQRIAEQLAAREQLSGVLQGARAADISVAGTQAGLEQQGTLANQAAVNQRAIAQGGLEQQSILQNAAAANDISIQQAILQQQAGLASQKAKNDFLIQQGIFDQQTALGNLGAEIEQRGLNQNFINALNEQIGGLTMGQQASLQELERLKMAKALEQQGLAAGAYKDWSGRMTGFLGGLGDSLTGSSFGKSMGTGAPGTGTGTGAGVGTGAATSGTVLPSGAAALPPAI